MGVKVSELPEFSGSVVSDYEILVNYSSAQSSITGRVNAETLLSDYLSIGDMNSALSTYIQISYSGGSYEYNELLEGYLADKGFLPLGASTWSGYTSSYSCLNEYLDYNGYISSSTLDNYLNNYLDSYGYISITSASVLDDYLKDYLDYNDYISITSFYRLSESLDTYLDNGGYITITDTGGGNYSATSILSNYLDNYLSSNSYLSESFENLLGSYNVMYFTSGQEINKDSLLYGNLAGNGFVRFPFIYSTCDYTNMTSFLNNLSIPYYDDNSFYNFDAIDRYLTEYNYVQVVGVSDYSILPSSFESYLSNYLSTYIYQNALYIYNQINKYIT